MRYNFNKFPHGNFSCPVFISYASNQLEIYKIFYFFSFLSQQKSRPLKVAACELKCTAFIVPKDNNSN